MLIKEILLEALKPSQYRKYVRAWDREKYDRAIFPNGEYRIYLPLQHSSETKQIVVPEEIQKVLSDNGFTVTDWVAGKAKDKYGRDVNIGKILNKFAPNLKDIFDKDPQRAAGKSGEDSLIVISRHPYDIAGMSTDRGWTSCMNLKGGGNKKYVMFNVKGGSLIAYLINKDDRNINNPKARVLINPYINNANPEEVALGVNSTVYGTAPPEFLKTVINWADGINASKNLEGVYSIHPKIYPETDSQSQWFGKIPSDDKGQIELINKFSDAFRLIRNPSRKVQEFAIEHDPYNIQYISNPDEKLQYLAVSLDPETIYYIENPTEKVQMSVVKNYSADIASIKNPSEKVQMYVVRSNPNNIGFIKNPSVQAQMAAVKVYPDAIEYIENPAEEVQMVVVKGNPYLIGLINNPTEAVQLTALKLNIDSFDVFAGAACEKAILYILDRKPDLLKYYNYSMPEDIQYEMINRDINHFKYLRRPTEGVQLAAVTKDPSLIKEIIKPSAAVKQAAKEATQKLKKSKVITPATKKVKQKITPVKRKTR